jgi:hypothetical protein
VVRVEAAFHRSRSQRRPGSHWPGDTLEVLGFEVFKLKHIAEQFSRTLGDNDRVWLSDALQACR